MSDGKGNIFLSTEHGLSTFYPVEETFHNWTKEQGLKSDHFNAASGTLRKNGNFIFGSTDGAIEFNKDMILPRDYKFKWYSVTCGYSIRPFIPRMKVLHLFWILTRQNLAFEVQPEHLLIAGLRHQL